MNAKTAKLIRRTAKAFKAQGTVTDERKSIRHVKKEYQKKGDIQRAVFKVALKELQQSLNKDEKNLS